MVGTRTHIDGLMEKTNFNRNFCLFPFIFTGKKWPEGKIETFSNVKHFLMKRVLEKFSNHFHKGGAGGKGRKGSR